MGEYMSKEDSSTTIKIDELDLTDEEKLMGFVGYFFSWLGALLIILMGKHKQSEFLAFVTYQSLLLTVVFIISWITCILGIVIWLVMIYMAIMAYTGKKITLPIIGPMAEDMVKKGGI